MALTLVSRKTPRVDFFKGECCAETKEKERKMMLLSGCCEGIGHVPGKKVQVSLWIEGFQGCEFLGFLSGLQQKGYG